MVSLKKEEKKQLVTLKRLSSFEAKTAIDREFKKIYCRR